MPDDPVQFTESGARKIVRAVRQVEDLSLSKPSTRPKTPSSIAPNIRAILLEPMPAGSTVKAERTKFDQSRFWFDVCLVGYPTDVESVFTLTLTTNTTEKTSEEIRIDATAADLATALKPWGLTGRVAVGFGKRDDLISGRWSIGVAGPFTLDSTNLDEEGFVEPLVELSVAGTIAGSAGLVVTKTKWRPTGEIIDLHEGGLILQNSLNTPLRPGTAVHASYHHGAGYVVHAAESRKFSTLYLVPELEEEEY